jgi:hypothetical protein
MLAVFAAPALAQSKECNDENKAAWYDTFLKNYKGEPPQQKIAYDAAKGYKDSCPADASDQQMAYMQKFIDAYDKVHQNADLGKQFEDAVKNAKYAEQVRLGKLVLANDPDNVKVYIIMAVAGLNDASLLAESGQHAKTAIGMIETGKPFAPLFDSNADKALANLNYVIAKATVQADPTGAIAYFLKALKYNSPLSKEARIYAELAGAYGAGPVTKLHDDYQKFVGQTESTESKLVVANLNQAIDRQIDALARAAALAATPEDKQKVMDVLSGIYKDRYNKPDGLNELVAGVLSKPLPEFPQPITQLPSTPTSTPTTGSSGTNGATSSNSGTNGQNKTGANGPTTTNGNKSTTTTNGAKPAATPTPPNNRKPRRSNHIVR